MTDISEQVREVLEDLSEDIEMAKNEWQIENAIMQALSQIDALYHKKFEEMLPKEMTIWDTSGVEGKMPIGLKLHSEGFNTCLKTIKEKLNE